MSLAAKQAKFAVMLAELIIWADKAGYRVTFGDAYRDPRVHGHLGRKKGYGHRNSNHKQRLAVDLNLFRKDVHGRYRYVSATKAHEPLGLQWESMGGTWGGRFADGNHYSLEHQGIK